jgi:hypothetical protein
MQTKNVRTKTSDSIMEGEGQAYIGLVILDLTVPANVNITALCPVVRQTLKGSQNIFHLCNICIFYAPQSVSSIGRIVL